MNIKLAFAAAMKAKRTWDRIPPEQRKKMLDAAVVQARTHGPVVAKKISDTAKTHGPVVAKKVADTAKTHGPRGVAKKISDTLERRLERSSSQGPDLPSGPPPPCTRPSSSSTCSRLRSGSAARWRSSSRPFRCCAGYPTGSAPTACGRSGGAGSRSAGARCSWPPRAGAWLAFGYWGARRPRHAVDRDRAAARREGRDLPDPRHERRPPRLRARSPAQPADPERGAAHAPATDADRRAGWSFLATLALPILGVLVTT